MSHLRIENDEVFGNTTRIWYVADDDSETEISNCIHRVDFTTDVGSVNRATLHAIKVKSRMTAEVDEILVRNVPSRWRRLRRRLEVTTFNRSGSREFLAVALVALAVAAPAHAYYADGGSGGGRPDCTYDNLGDGFGNWVCSRDAFTGSTDWEWG